MHFMRIFRSKCSYLSMLQALILGEIIFVNLFRTTRRVCITEFKELLWIDSFLLFTK